MALAPLRPFGIRAVVVSTMQAVSGAGYPGVPSLDILGNVVPFIGGEEEKMRERDAEDPRQRRRPRAAPGGRQRAHQPRAGDRRPHHDGLGRISSAQPSIDDDRRRRCATFRGRPQELDLPSAPQPPIVVMRRAEPPAAAARRRPRRRHGGHASAACAPCPVLHAKFVALGHNTVRGAAGAAILNAELMHAEGLLVKLKCRCQVPVELQVGVRDRAELR